MRFRTYLALLALGAAGLSATPIAVMAQSTLTGPVVPGVCLVSQEGVFANAKIGLAATARLRQLAQAPADALNAERAQIVADAKTLDAQKGSLTAAQFRERQQTLVERDQAYQAKFQGLDRQIEATRQKALGQIAEAAQPVIAQVYQAHGCGLLFAREAVLGGNMSNDLTAAVVEGLDAKVTTIIFDLEPPQPAPAAAGQ